MTSICNIIDLVCTMALDLENHPLSPDSASKVTCYVPSLCTAVDCCVDVLDLDMSFHAYLSIDPCRYTLRIGIDKYSFTVSLDQMEYGKTFVLI